MDTVQWKFRGSSVKFLVYYGKELVGEDNYFENVLLGRSLSWQSHIPLFFSSK